jgi:hypothetical protein
VILIRTLLICLLLAASLISGCNKKAPSPAAQPGKPVAPQEQVSSLTKEQLDKITPDSTYDDVVKATGQKGKLVNESGDKQTYEYQLKDEPGYYVHLIFYKNGKLSEKNVFRK